MSVTIHQGDILTAKTDFIVNPANGHLRHGGGLAAIIARAAKDFGREVVPVTQPHGLHTIAEEDRIRELRDAWDAEQSAHPLVPTGGAGLTSAGSLPFKGIIHAVGPIWGGGAYYERQLLRLAHQNACAVARWNGGRYGGCSIAFPAISCGIFGFPVAQAAPTAVQAVLDFYALPQPNGLGMDVQFWLFEDAHYEAYQRALDARSK